MRNHEFSTYYQREGLEQTSYDEDTKNLPSAFAATISDIRTGIGNLLQWGKRVLTKKKTTEEISPVQSTEVEAYVDSIESTHVPVVTQTTAPLFVRAAQYIDIQTSPAPTISSEKIAEHAEQHDIHESIRTTWIPQLAETSGYAHTELWSRYCRLLIENQGNPRTAYTALRRTVVTNQKKGNTQIIAK